MNTVAKTKTSRLPRAKIALELGLLLKKQPFRLQIQKTPLGSRIVRIVTPAWEKLRPAERIERVRKAIEPVLSEEELNEIFRFSVLTPTEYETLLGISDDGMGTRSKTVARLVSKTPAKSSMSAGRSARIGMRRQ